MTRTSTRRSTGARLARDEQVLELDGDWSVTRPGCDPAAGLSNGIHTPDLDDGRGGARLIVLIRPAISELSTLHRMGRHTKAGRAVGLPSMPTTRTTI